MSSDFEVECEVQSWITKMASMNVTPPLKNENDEKINEHTSTADLEHNSNENLQLMIWTEFEERNNNDCGTEKTTPDGHENPSSIPQFMDIPTTSNADETIPKQVCITIIAY